MPVVDYDEDRIRQLPCIQPPVTLSTVAKRLGITRPNAVELIYSGLAEKLLNKNPDTEPLSFIDARGNPVLLEEGLQALEAVPFLEQIPEKAINVRVRAGRRVDEPERSFIGWDATYSEEEADLATSRWWLPLKGNVIGMPFIVSISGYIVRCGRIISVEDPGYGRVAYNVDWMDSNIQQTWANHRVKTPAGSSVVYLR